MVVIVMCISSISCININVIHIRISISLIDSIMHMCGVIMSIHCMIDICVASMCMSSVCRCLNISSISC